MYAPETRCAFFWADNVFSLDCASGTLCGICQLVVKESDRVSKLRCSIPPLFLQRSDSFFRIKGVCSENLEDNTYDTRFYFHGLINRRPALL